MNFMQLTTEITEIWHEMVTVPLCCICCVRSGNPKRTCNDELALFTTDKMTFLFAEWFIAQ